MSKNSGGKQAGRSVYKNSVLIIQIYQTRTVLEGCEARDESVCLRCGALLVQERARLIPKICRYNFVMLMTPCSIIMKYCNLISLLGVGRKTRAYKKVLNNLYPLCWRANSATSKFITFSFFTAYMREMHRQHVSCA